LILDAVPEKWMMYPYRGYSDGILPSECRAGIPAAAIILPVPDGVRRVSAALAHREGAGGVFRAGPELE
jgi:hypothetical protein